MDTVGTGSASQFRLYERQLGWKPPCPRRGRRPSKSGTRRCAQPEVREPSALLTPAQSSKRAIFTWGQSMPSRKEDRPFLAADSEPSEWCGAALDVI